MVSRRSRGTIAAYSDDGLIDDYTVCFNILDGKYSFRADLDIYFELRDESKNSVDILEKFDESE